MFRKASKLLEKQLIEQILPDGAHYEQSPMYHCILLDRLLDCYNTSYNNAVFDGQDKMNVLLKNYASLMLGHLLAIIWKNGEIPILNDSANHIAPHPSKIFEYAERLSIPYNIRPLQECGYRKIKNDRIEAIVDVGNIMARYQPGHTHSDLFNYEVLIDGNPFIVDTGVSTYNKTSRRQYERSSKSHNTLVINNTDYYQVWGGFRVGKRISSKILEDGESVSAQCKLYNNAVILRRFSADSDMFKIMDHIEGTQVESCESYIHFANGVNIISADNNIIRTSYGEILLTGVESVTVRSDYYSTEYNSLKQSEYVIIVPEVQTSGVREINYMIRPNKLR